MSPATIHSFNPRKSMPDPWYAYFVVSNDRAAAELTEAGFDIFAPTYERIVRRGRAKVLRPVALIPGYVFARTGPGGFPAALACKSVVYVLSSAGHPWPIAEQPIADIAALLETGRMDERLPAKRSRPRGIRRRGLTEIQSALDELKRQMEECRDVAA